MIITNDIKSKSIELEVLEKVELYYPSYRIQIKLKTENIEASFRNSLWISFDDVNKFVTELNALDESRDGIALLQSMSPDQMKLSIKTIDTQGHLGLEFHVSKQHGMPDNYSFSVGVEFEIDATIIGFIVNELLQLKGTNSC